MEMDLPKGKATGTFAFRRHVGPTPLGRAYSNPKPPAPSLPLESAAESPAWDFGGAHQPGLGLPGLRGRSGILEMSTLCYVVCWVGKTGPREVWQLA